MVKSYLKYELSDTFGVVTSSTSNSVWSPNEDAQTTASRSTGAGRVYVGANEEVLCWDAKKSELLSRWRDPDCSAEVTTITRCEAGPDLFAVGYSDGSIRLWDASIGSVLISLNGHRSAVTVLAFDNQGIRLASGAKDTDIIVWDLVTETGLFKLKGHKDQVTGLHFLHPSSQINAASEVTNNEGERADAPNTLSDDIYLMSSSKDALLKIWDISSQYCIETHVTQSNGECWTLAVSPDKTGCITGGTDGELQVWSLDLEGLQSRSTQLNSTVETKYLHNRGALNRQGSDRTTGIRFHPSADFIAVHGVEKAVELFRVRTTKEVESALARKRRRRREKAGAASETLVNSNGNVTGEDSADTKEDISSAHVTDVFVPFVILRTGGKVRSIDWAGWKPNQSMQLLVSTTNNQLEVYNTSIQKKPKTKGDDMADYDRTHSVELPGHKADVRAVSLSSDDRMLASASAGSLKIWNLRTQSCLRTLECGYALCCSFLPGDKIVIIGNKNGDLELFDIASSTLIETIKAHEGSIWTLKAHPDGKSIATGGADKTVKFWKFEVVQEDIPGTRRSTARLKLVHARTLKVNDDVLSLCFSPDSRLIAVSTLDNTVKVFFIDTLKLFLNLYGHKLPVLSISIASDSKLIATCSADKNIRLWGLDFGDCHKALFAHDESIMQVAFIPQPAKEEQHLFFSVSKDHLLKSWDGDKFEHVQKLRGHHGEIWSMAVSRTGDFVVTASHDKSIRVWSQSDEPLFLEEERERELEEMYDANLETTLEKDQIEQDQAGEADEDGVIPASKQTATSLTASEKIEEALTLCFEDFEMMQEHEANNPPGTAPPQRHPLLALRAISAEAHLLSVVETIPAPALQDSLLLLPFTTLSSLFVFLSTWLQKEMNVPLTCRILFFLLKVHHKQVVASRELRTQLQEMQRRLRECLGSWKSTMGFNLAATKVLGSRVKDQRIKTIEDEEELREAQLGGKKRGFVNVA